MRTVHTPISKETVASFKVGEQIMLVGRIICGRDAVLPKMSELRAACDEAETLTAKEFWPFPTYADILFSVR